MRKAIAIGLVLASPFIAMMYYAAKVGGFM